MWPGLGAQEGPQHGDGAEDERAAAQATARVIAGEDRLGGLVQGLVWGDRETERSSGGPASLPSSLAGRTPTGAFGSLEPQPRIPVGTVLTVCIGAGPPGQSAAHHSCQIVLSAPG